MTNTYPKTVRAWLAAFAIGTLLVGLWPLGCNPVNGNTNDEVTPSETSTQEKTSEKVDSPEPTTTEPAQEPSPTDGGTNDSNAQETTPIPSLKQCDLPSATFYTPPTATPNSSLQPGDVVRCEEMGDVSAATLGADARFSVGGGTASFGYRLVRIMYVTQWPKGALRWATALLYLPLGSSGACRPNAEIAMVGHGTMGMADSCGPSRFPNFGLHHLTYPLVGRGVAVVAPDFLGLGVGIPEGHPYLMTEPTVWSSLDAVKAARSMANQGPYPGCLHSKVMLLGHSQGGHAALTAATLFSSYLSGYQLLGTVAWGPAFGDERLWLGPFAANFKVTTATAYFLAYLLAAQRTRKGPALSQWLTAKAAQRIPGLLDTVCFAEWDALLQSQFKTFQDVFTPAFLQASVTCNAGKDDCKDFQFWRDAIAATQVPAQAPSAPTLLVQGSADAVVSASSVGCIAKRWGTKASACVYTQANHTTIIGTAWKAILPWIESIRQGNTPQAPACESNQLPACP